ncbi:hypothetical protein FGO68_gene9626 [Halteria grandinella]|uniref:Uncharacterized protein n=1 Tax=Halteria grandinella TaxID=5974 RepID=A0A8J8P219_HALGN|nr:hypothetical protein FGO68_gene9626 [Halteria grandinella]
MFCKKQQWDRMKLILLCFNELHVVLLALLRIRGSADFAHEKQTCSRNNQKFMLEFNERLHGQALVYEDHRTRYHILVSLRGFPT